MKIAKTKPRKGPNAVQMIIKQHAVEMKEKAQRKECKPKETTPKIKKLDKKIQKKMEEQERFLLFLQEDKSVANNKNE